MIKSNNFIFPLIASIILFLSTIFLFAWVVEQLNEVDRELTAYQQVDKEWITIQKALAEQKKNESYGVASYYDYSLNGKLWSKDHRTAASRDLPRYSYAKVINLANNKEVIVYINDHGPEEWTKREIDLSSFAFSQLAPLSLGLIKVKIIPWTITLN